MQIQLKQAEIVAAIKGYITSQGINLHNRTVDIAFTAGRKESGLTADVVIEDVAFPTSEPLRAVPVANVLAPAAVIAEAEEERSEPMAEPEVVAEPRTTSLFS